MGFEKLPVAFLKFLLQRKWSLEGSTDFEKGKVCGPIRYDKRITKILLEGIKKHCVDFAGSEGSLESGRAVLGPRGTELWSGLTWPWL